MSVRPVREPVGYPGDAEAKLSRRQAKSRDPGGGCRFKPDDGQSGFHQ